MGVEDHHDGLDEVAWERLRRVVSAANQGKRRAFKSEFRRWSTEISLGDQHRIGIYLLGATKYMTRRTLKRQPTESDLKNLAARCFPDVSKVVTAHAMAVEDTLRIMFDLPAVRRELSPGELLVLGAAITGCLLTSPADELPEIRQYVAAWWKVNAHVFHDQGVADSG